MATIVFYNKETNEIVDGSRLGLFVMDDEVCQDNNRTCESQESVVCFYDFIRERPDIGWRVE